MQSENIHLVKAAFHTQFKVAMEKNKIPAAKYFKAVNLPVDVKDPEGLLPLMPFYKLINMVAIKEELPDFGSRIAHITPWHKVASLAPLIEQSHNLKELLSTFCEVASGQSSPVIFSVKDEGAQSSFCYTNTALYRGEVQMELYRITSMIQLVQLATVADWRPESIRLIMPETDIVTSSPLLKNSELTFSQEDSAITIPNKFMTLPVQMGIREFIDVKDVKDVKEQADLNIEFVKSIKQIIHSYTLANKTSLKEVAGATNMSARTLQRRLSACNLQFNDLVKESKFLHAKTMLRDIEISITEIARDLGYSDAAHFTRAFHQWSGISPSQYRSQL